MWYRYFQKESWNLRIWRKANLKFHQDDFGMYRHKSVGQIKDFVFRLSRTEGVMRGFNFFLGIGVLNVLIWANKVYFEPKFGVPKKEAAKKELEEKDRIAKETLFFNRFGAPTRPHKSLDDLLVFLAGSWTYDQLADFISYNNAMDINMDQQKGLDSWMSEEDRRMLERYQAQQKKKSH
eukprot:TRINITY_DN12853_c0_g1_i3.p1 TRINITY_DN12853_c0_g1~~TRINITY_DN12853_c0_g1_i3.p1  ORF type:complete len:179 (-),score=58.72 TRINITY_DN12853_c0_g1_i3:119-655(-)